MRNIKHVMHGSCLMAAPPQCNNVLHWTQLKRSSQTCDPLWLLSTSLVKNIFVLVCVIYKIVVYYIVFCTVLKFVMNYFGVILKITTFCR